ncbi:hypothetical protein DERF_008684 [Dermatophagoides farinae]|nr:hypothetical protein DERF_008684 [Dermatophagoides farinae]
MMKTISPYKDAYSENRARLFDQNQCSNQSAKHEHTMKTLTYQQSFEFHRRWLPMVTTGFMFCFFFT